VEEVEGGGEEKRRERRGVEREETRGKGRGCAGQAGE